MTETHFTVVGGQGFIGSHLVEHLRRSGHHCDAPPRGTGLRAGQLGHVIFCAGVTGDFRSRPYDTVDAHVGALADVVRSGGFDSLVYLSSSRVYKRHEAPTARETDELRVDPLVFDDLYGLSKMMGESLALAAAPDRAHIVRLSNVYGDGFDQPGFLYAVLKEAIMEKRITLRTSPDSSRDYIAVTDVVDVLTRIALEGKERVYNVASGVNRTHGELAAAIAELTGCDVTVQANAPTVTCPSLSIERIRNEFGVSPASLLDDLPRLVASGTRYWRQRVLD